MPFTPPPLKRSENIRYSRELCKTSYFREKRFFMYIFIFFGLLNLFSSFSYSSTQKTLLSKNISSIELNFKDGVIIGPFKTLKKREVVDININASIPRQSWLFIDGEMLDKNKEYLFGFSKELSYYSGRDAEGQWTEYINTATTKVTIPKPGTYYVKIKSEQEYYKPLSSARITISKKNGSTIPHIWMGIFCLICACVTHEKSERVTFKDSDNFSLILVLFGFYLIMSTLSSNGYGYTGYRGYHYRGSIFHSSDTRIYTERSTRSGSVYGTRTRGGGPGSGK